MKKLTIRVLTIDPGLTNTGWAVIDYDVQSGKYVVSSLGAFHPGPTADKATYRDDTEKFSKRTISLKLLRENLNGLFLDTKPDYVAVEDIFFNPSRPSAHAALAMWHSVARMAAYDILHKPVEIIQTKIAKQYTTGSGGNGKLTVQQSIMNNPNIKFRTKQIEMSMDEHCADAIAVGYAFVEKNKDRILMEMGPVTQAS